MLSGGLEVKMYDGYVESENEKIKLKMLASSLEFLKS